MTKQTIEIDVPEGWEIEKAQACLYDDEIPYIKVSWGRKPPRRRVFVCVSEEPRNSKDGEWIEDIDGDLRLTKGDGYGKYKIFKEITE